MIAHVSVVSLVAAAGFAGISGTAETASHDGQFGGSAPFVTTVYGAAIPSQQFETSRFDTQDADEKVAILDRKAHAVIPQTSGPRLESVPVIGRHTASGPQGIGSTSTAAGVTTTTRACPAPATPFAGPRRLDQSVLPRRPPGARHRRSIRDDDHRRPGRRRHMGRMAEQRRRERIAIDHGNG